MTLAVAVRVRVVSTSRREKVRIPILVHMFYSPQEVVLSRSRVTRRTERQTEIGCSKEPAGGFAEFTADTA